MLFLLCPLVDAESTGFHFDGWLAATVDWIVGGMGRLVSQEKKNKNCLTEIWTSLRDEAPVHHHAEGRKESAFFFTQLSLAAQQEIST